MEKPTKIQVSRVKFQVWKVWGLLGAGIVALAALAATEPPTTAFTRTFGRAKTADAALAILGVDTNGLDTNVVTMSVETLTANQMNVGTNAVGFTNTPQGIYFSNSFALVSTASGTMGLYDPALDPGTYSASFSGGTVTIADLLLSTGMKMNFGSPIKGQSLVTQTDDGSAAWQWTSDYRTNFDYTSTVIVKLDRPLSLCMTNSPLGDMDILITNIVDGMRFDLRAVSGDNIKLSFYAGAGTMRWLNTNYNTGTSMTNVNVPSGKAVRVSGKAWIFCNTTNLDLEAVVQP